MGGWGAGPSSFLPQEGPERVFGNLSTSRLINPQARLGCVPGAGPPYRENGGEVEGELA